MFVIAFEPGQWLGGYGDRIVGIVSVSLLAKCFRRRFQILWTKESISQWISLGSLEYSGPPSNQCDIVNCVDTRQALIDRLNRPTPFPNFPTFFRTNQEVAHLAYRYIGLSKEDFYSDILKTYQSLYTSLLQPTPALQAAAGQFDPIDLQTPQIGIQIRCGDCYIQSSVLKGHCLVKDPGYHLPLMLHSIKAHIEQTYPSYTIFITSDYPTIHTIAQAVFGSCVRGVDGEVQHLDCPLRTSLEKVFLDHYILSTKCQRLYISTASNYGRIAALASLSSSNELYDTTTRSINRIDMLSKEGISF